MADIRVEELRFHYTEGVPVLRGIDLTLGAGATAIVGQNGAGKSTFVRMLNGLLKPVSGRVTIDGEDTREATVARLARLARRVGLVFQNPADQLFKSKVVDEVMFGPRNLGLTPQDARERAEKALAELHLTDLAESNPYDLGLAERKLVTVAGIVAMESDTIILDEPTIAQDMAGVERLGRLIARLRESGRTVLTITHDMDFVASYFGRVVVIRDGVIIADGSPASIFAEDETLAAAGLEAPQIVQLARRVGMDPPALTVEEFLRRYGADAPGRINTRDRA